MSSKLVSGDGRTHIESRLMRESLQDRKVLSKTDSERDLQISVMEFGIEVRNRKHLADVIRRVRRLGVVHGVERL